MRARCKPLTVVAAGALFVVTGWANAAEPVGPKLTPRLKDLITEEMQLISGDTFVVKITQDDMFGNICCESAKYRISCF